MKIRKKRNHHSKGPRGEQIKLGKLKNQGGKHLQCGLRLNGKVKSRMNLERSVGAIMQGFVNKEKGFGCSTQCKRKPLGGFNGENDFIFGETLKETKAEAKIMIEILVITNGGGTNEQQLKDGGF